jgi:HSP20 family protein
MNMVRFNQPTLSMLDQFFGNALRETERSSHAANIYDTDNSFVIEMAVPGFSKDDIKINLEQQTLNISAEAKSSEVADDKWLRQEFSYRNLQRSFILPKTVDVDNISADYQNGMLKVILPRKADAVIKKEIAIS